MIFAPLSHTEASARIAGLPLLTRDVFDGLLPELKAHAFVVSGVTVMDELSRLRDMIAAVPSGEATWQEAKKTLTDDLEARLGPDEAPRRAELLLRTHTFRSYAVSRYRLLMAQRAAFPFWQYQTHGDERVRPSHRALDGKIFPAGHPIWQRIFPPWDWGCRCLVVPRTGKSVRAIRDREQGEANKAPEDLLVYDGDMADAIHAAERLPNGIALTRAPTWSDSPWGVPGEVRDLWPQIEARYAADPEVLAAFLGWAEKTEIEPGRTVSMWLGRDKPEAPKPEPKAKRKRKAKVKPEPEPAPEAKAVTVASLTESLASLGSDYDQAMAAVQAATQAAHAALPAIFHGYRGDMEGLLKRAVPVEFAAIAKAKASLQAVIAKARDAVSLPTAERGKIPLKLRDGLGSARSKVAKEGALIVERYTHPSLLPPTEVMKAWKVSGQRYAAGYIPSMKVVVLKSDSTASTMAHEIMHVLEDVHRDVLASSLDFLRQRAGGVPAKRLSELTGYKDYTASEIAFEDEWLAKGGSHYTGKDYGGIATEILSMGIERLHRDPLLFARTDPDYLAYVLKTLRKL